MVVLSLAAIADYIFKNPKTQTEVELASFISENDSVHHPYTPKKQSLEIDPVSAAKDLQILDSFELLPNRIQQGGWVPPWSHTPGTATINQYGQDFTFISPVWYSPQPDGTLISRRPSNYQDLLDAAALHDLQVIPSIGSFDPDLMRSIFRDPTNRSRHVDALVTDVLRNDYDGVDLDYEMIYMDDKAGYEAFILELNDKLDRYDKILSVTVISKWEDVTPNRNSSVFGQTRAIQDWEFIAQNSDQLRIMAYDYTTTGNPNPGPVSPLSWNKQILDYAITKAPRDKIWLGVNLYGYTWGSDGSRKAVSYDQMIRYPEFEQRVLHDVYNEAYLEYRCSNNITCKAFFTDKQTLELKRKLAQQYNIAGVTYWRIGNEADLLAYD